VRLPSFFNNCRSLEEEEEEDLAAMKINSPSMF
jgi:hypothetical protein